MELDIWKHNFEVTFGIPELIETLTELPYFLMDSVRSHPSNALKENDCKFFDATESNKWITNNLPYPWESNIALPKRYLGYGRYMDFIANGTVIEVQFDKHRMLHSDLCRVQMLHQTGAIIRQSKIKSLIFVVVGDKIGDMRGKEKTFFSKAVDLIKSEIENNTFSKPLLPVMVIGVKHQSEVSEPHSGGIFDLVS